jgi:hypothetical protein
LPKSIGDLNLCAATAVVVLALFLSVPAFSAELFRFHVPATEGGELEYIFEADETENSGEAVDKSRVAEIAAEFMTHFYHVQSGALETQELRRAPFPFWLICFSDGINRPLSRLYFVVVLANGKAIEPRLARRL